MDRRLSPRFFDADKPLVTTKQTLINGVEHSPGDVINADEVEQGTRMRMWLTARAVYQEDYRPTEVIDPVEEAKTLVTVEPAGGGWFIINAPWFAEPEKVQGKEAADKRAAEVIERGDTKGVEVTGGAGGWYVVTAPWLAIEGERIQGLDAATARADELIVEGPPPAAEPVVPPVVEPVPPVKPVPPEAPVLVEGDKAEPETEA